MMALLTNFDQQKTMLERLKPYFLKADGNALTATTASKIGTDSVGDTSTPVYINAGTPTVCDALSSSSISAEFGDSAGSHNAFFRGKYLGSTLTDEQSAAIRAGTFDDMYVGDYWTIGSIVTPDDNYDINWRIADFDYFLNSGDTSCTTHHVVVVPDIYLCESGGTTGTYFTSGGYVGSRIYTSGLVSAKRIVTSAFGEDHVLTHREYLTNAVTNGYPSAGAWYDSTVELMNEIMVYGCHVHAPMGNGSTIPNKYTLGNSQLALFRLCKRFINYQRDEYWLRDVVSSDCFAVVDSDGSAYLDSPLVELGVRPAVAIY